MQAAAVWREHVGKKKRLREAKKKKKENEYKTAQQLHGFTVVKSVIIRLCLSKNGLYRPGSDPQIYHLHLNKVIGKSSCDVHFCLTKRSLVYRQGMIR